MIMRSTLTITPTAIAMITAVTSFASSGWPPVFRRGFSGARRTLPPRVCSS